MQITVLGSGTSQGIPVIACPCDVCASTAPLDKRLRASVLIQTKNTTIAIDAGPDFRQQMLREKVNQLDAIFITHEHKDHTGGLDDVRSYNYLLKRPMKVYASHATLEALRREYAYAFWENKYPGVPEFDFRDLENGKAVTIGDITIVPIEVKHLSMPVFAFRINNFAYITDANFISENSMEQLKGIDYLIIGAPRKQKHISHFNLEEAIEISQQLGAKKTWFTHISHMMGKTADVTPILPESMNLAYDGLKFSI